MPDPDAPCTFKRRVAGAGSLGRQRFVALATDRRGLPVAREAKATVPSAAAWARNDKRPKIYIADLVRTAVRIADPCFIVSRSWMIRRLAPDCARIEIKDLPADRDELKLLRAMGWETANIHLGSKRRKIAKHLTSLPHRWLEHAAEEMATATTEDFRAWVAGSRI